MSAINLRDKATTVHFVETIETEAANYLGLTTKRSINQKIRPYSQYIPGIVGATASIAALSTSSTDKKDEKKKSRHFINIALSTLSALFTSHQARNATRAREISESYQSAALLLSGNQLFQHTPLKALGEKIYKLTTDVVQIDKMREKEANNYLNCGILGGFGAGLFALGAYVPAAWMKSAGKVVLVATILLYGYTWLSHRGSQTLITKNYQGIGPLAEEIRRDLHSFTNAMDKTDADMSTYVALVPEFVPAK